MGELTRNFDWSTSSLGAIEDWPDSLRITVRNMLWSRLPTLVLWGSDFICFHNDAVIPILAGDIYPAVGKKAKDIWKEDWEAIAPIFESILSTGNAVTTEGQHIFQPGSNTDDACWDVSYSLLLDDQDVPGGILVSCVAMTESALSQSRLRESEKRFHALVRDATVGIVVLTGSDMNVEIVNNAYCKLIGRKYDDVINKPLFTITAEAEEYFRPIIEKVKSTGEELYLYEIPYAVSSPEGNKEGFLNLVYQPYRRDDGDIAGTMVLCHNITEQVKARRAIEISESKLRSIIAAAPVAIGLFVGRDLIIENPNQTFIDIVGKGPHIEGKPLREAMPELMTEGQPFLKILDDVYTKGVAFTSPASLVRIVQDGVLNDNYYNISYVPLFDAEGSVYAILDIAVDVTEQVKAQQAVTESESRFRNLVMQAPVAMAVFRGEKYITEIANDNYLKLVDKRASDFLGIPLFESLPHVQPFIETIVREVVTTGKPFYGRAFEVTLERKGAKQVGFFDFVYSPLYEPDGKANGFIVVAHEVTEQVLTRRKLADSRTALQNAIELAQLGTWKLHADGRSMIVSRRHAEMVGLRSRKITLEQAMAIVVENDRDDIAKRMRQAMNPDSDGHFDAEYRIVNPITGRTQIIHAIGRAYFNDAQFSRFEGTTQDITAEREVQLALENQVQMRTEELATSNEELQATNEELAAINEELSDSTERLLHSNDELRQFAYAASHDLQEPLRKVRIFADRLLHVDGVPEMAQRLTLKMAESSERMTSLVNSLLEFSHIAEFQHPFEQVDLATTVDEVVEDFEYAVEEKNAVIECSPLPVVEASRLQMQQLFANLISNAMKFARPGIRPHVSIHGKLVDAEGVKEYIEYPARRHYVHLSIADNGTGFDMQYADHIFEIFRRLHTQKEYKGSGIGLALCKKIVLNHKGFIKVQSIVGEGTTFHIILPV